MSQKGEITRIAFEHVVMKLQTQREDLSNIRNRASISAAITGLIATFFATAIGSERLSHQISGESFFGLSVPTLLVLAFFCGSIAMSARVVAMNAEFTFSFNAEKMLEKSEDAGVYNFYPSYVRDGEWFFQDNERKIEAAQSDLFWAVVLGWTQIIPWMLHL